MSNITLDEFRNWLAGDLVEGLPHRDFPKEPGPERLKDKVKASRRGPERPPSKVKRKRFDLHMGADGKLDVTLQFGKYKGQRVSDIVKTEDGRSYVRWMDSQGFERELMEPCLRMLKESATKRRRR